jgi:TatD DNase family protein
MIDVHCHLEQKDYENDRDEVINKCREKLKAIITSCAHPNDLELTIEIVKKYKGFVFATLGIHPEYIGENLNIKDFIEKVKKNKDNIVGIGEVGLDYHWVKEENLREKQRKLFRFFIKFAKELNLPLVIHSREAMQDTIKILEEEKAKNVLMHLFGDKKFVSKIIENGWFISVGPILLTSKNHKKIIKEMPIEKIMLETDSPWFGFGKRNEPIEIIKVAEKIAEIKKIGFNDVWNICGKNAIKFFNLPIEI